MAALAAGFAFLSHEFAVLGAVKLDFLVFFHFISSLFFQKQTSSSPPLKPF
jgi:hypothetical protein